LAANDGLSPCSTEPNHRPAFFRPDRVYKMDDLKCNTAIFVCRIIPDGDRRNGKRAERHEHRQYAEEPDHVPTGRAKPILTPIVRAIMDVDREGFGAMVLRCDLV